MELLRTPGFFAPDVPAARVEFTSREMFRFASPVPSGIPENDVVRGRMMKGGRDWERRPAAILVHGWNAELQYQWMIPFWSALLARAGVNAISFELPYHSSRRPRGPEAIRNFFSGNLLHVARATHQTLGEISALTRWLREAGAPQVGVWGTSLGAWLSGLAIANQPELGFSVLFTPVARLDRALRDLDFCAAIRGQMNDFEAELAPLNLVSHRPLCAAEEVLVVSSDHDLFAPEETIVELERAWMPEVWRLPHGHISVLLSAYVIRRIVKWIKDRTMAASRLQAPISGKSAS